ncbi:hypothetical protein BDW02DRAFT_567215 [Decorospora gaudefroyi]|uniref:Basic proline-rich protein n=1 Tax=Decorospora gaudefroyi TaxID=184978 RepID=A0A6A5KRK8_9PLEO|nr:hypothetical protein BDW02DRAFT_567215 [Decorospora gaudefroyi]
MSAANPSSSPPDTSAEQRRAHLVHLVHDPIPLRSPTKASAPEPAPAPAPSPRTKVAAQGAPLPPVSTPHLSAPTQAGRPLETDTMGETTTPARQVSNSSDSRMAERRPSTPRSQTDPPLDTLSSLASPYAQPRNRSPYARSHLRSHSGSGSPSAPPMTRAHSLPTVMHTASSLMLSPSPMSLARPTSPLPSPKRTRSPRAMEPRPHTTGPPERYGSGFRPASTGSFEGAPSVCDISEDAELELTPRAGTTTTVSSLYSSTGSLSRRRRPASPLYHVSVPFGLPPTSTPSVSTPTSAASSPLLAPSRFNENYPASIASSSIPSTPTSMRSRSPSISSLETIEDSPDAEEEAIEADRIAKLKAAAEREDDGEQRRSSLDVPEGRGRSLGFGKRDSRKRWSVCGAERRGDLDLETIWED